MDYRVTWSIDVCADSPEDAARQALDLQGGLATVFDVSDGTETVTVDLTEIDEAQASWPDACGDPCL